MRWIYYRKAVFATLVLLWAAAAQAQEKGWIGITVSTSLEISSSPTLRAASVAEVEPGSPAAKSGLEKGDEILEVDGIVVAGAKASQLGGSMRKNVGEILKLKVRRGTAAPRDVNLVAIKKAN